MYHEGKKGKVKVLDDLSSMYVTYAII